MKFLRNKKKLPEENPKLYTSAESTELNCERKGREKENTKMASGAPHRKRLWCSATTTSIQSRPHSPIRLWINRCVELGVTRMLTGISMLWET